MNSGEVLQGRFLGFKDNIYYFQLKNGTKRQFHQDQVSDMKIISNTPDKDDKKQNQEKVDKESPQDPVPQFEAEPIETEPANEQEVSEQEAEQIHKLFLSLNLGVGLSYLGLVDDLKHHLTGRAALQLGYRANRNIAIVGGLEHTLKPKTKVETNEFSGFEDEMTEFSYSYNVFMLGFTYYFAPFAIDIGAFGRLGLGGSYETLTSATLLGQTMEAEQKSDMKSDGIGFGIVVGKEWQASHKRSFGLSFSYSRDALKLTDPEVDPITIQYYGIDFHFKFNFY